MGLSDLDYGQHLLDLLPGGRAWRKDRDATMRKLAVALGAELARVDCRGEELRDESDPYRTAELLTDWERVAGLPDPCINQALDTNQRRAALVTRLAQRGGQSRAFYVELAAALGFTVTIIEFRPFTCVSACSDALTQDDWAHAWAVQAPLDTISTFTCLSACTDPLRSWGNSLLECALERVKPAHTVLLFQYVTPSQPKHFIFIYVDDPPPMPPWAGEVPWPEGEGTAYENRLPKTPNLDALAAAGVIATRAKTTAVCSPGRATCQTGVHVHRHGLGAVTRIDYNGDLEEFGDPGYAWPTLADRLKANPDLLMGFFGKLHLSNDVETEGGLGFDIFEQRLGPWDHAHFVRNNHNNPPFPEGHTVSNSGYFAFRKKVLPSGEEVDVLDDYSTKHWFDRARDFVLSAPTDKRLLVWIPQNTPHSPFDEPPAEAVATAEYLSDPPTAWKRQMAMTEAFDYYLGEFLASLPPEFLEQCTIVIAGDNGPDPAVMKSGRDDDGKEFGETWEALLDDDEGRLKASVYRYGDWCQLCWTGPNVQAPGTITQAPLHIVDLFPSLCEYFGVDAGEVEGLSMLGHLHEGEPFPRVHGAQFSGFFMPNGDWSAIVAAGAVWDDATDYAEDDEVTHQGRVYVAADDSGPGEGGAREPGATGSNNYWDVKAWADFSMEATVTGNPGGPAFNGRFKLIRRLGYADRVWQLYQLDGTPVTPYELPGEEYTLSPRSGGIDITAFLQGLLEAALANPVGPADAMGIVRADDVAGTLRQEAGGGFDVRSADDVSGRLTATDPPGDEAGVVRLDNAEAVAGELLLQVAVAVSGAVPITTAGGFPWTMPLDEFGGAPVHEADDTVGSLLIGEDGITIEDDSDTAGSLALV